MDGCAAGGSSGTAARTCARGANPSGCGRYRLGRTDCYSERSGKCSPARRPKNGRPCPPSPAARCGTVPRCAPAAWQTRPTPRPSGWRVRCPGWAAAGRPRCCCCRRRRRCRPGPPPPAAGAAGKLPPSSRSSGWWDTSSAVPSELCAVRKQPRSKERGGDQGHTVHSRCQASLYQQSDNAMSASTPRDTGFEERRKRTPRGRGVLSWTPPPHPLGPHVAATGLIN